MIKRLALLLSSVIAPFSLLILLEAGTRIIKPEINFQDTERGLLRENAFGDTYGWLPNASGVCFGQRVFIDEFGFRKLSSPESPQESWLILGDSVTFGVGVETRDTYVQLLQDEHPEARIWNTAVIGYDARNYKDVFDHFTTGDASLKNLKRVILFFCLNDVDLGGQVERDLCNRSARSQLTESTLSFLRRHSKLYILLKNNFSDRSRFYFTQDYQLYTDRDNGFKESMSILSEMNAYLRDRHVDFTVVILPYEYQLRTKESQNLLPQKRLAAYFAGQGIAYIDAYDYFARAGGEAKEDYLYADFGHFSMKGHRLVFNLLKERLSAAACASSGR